jgi:tetratricopeptide (TPR) repeat protein
VRRNMTSALAVLGLMLLPVLAFAVSSGELPEADQARLDAAADDQARHEILSAMVADRPADPAVQFHLGNVLYDLGQLEAAIEAYRAAIALDDQLVGAFVNLGSSLDEIGKLDDAITAYDAALKLDPNDPRTLCNMGGAYFQKRRYEKALQFFQDALAADPKSQLAHYNIAIAFADAQIYREAIVEWEAAVALGADTDIGRRSADNIEIIEQMMTSDIPDIGGR